MAMELLISYFQEKMAMELLKSSYFQERNGYGITKIILFSKYEHNINPAITFSHFNETER